MMTHLADLVCNPTLELQYTKLNVPSWVSGQWLLTDELDDKIIFAFLHIL